MTSVWEDLRERPSRSARWRATARRQPSAFLLLVQIVLILALPFLEGAGWGRVVITLLSLAAVVTAVFTVRTSPALTWLSMLLAAPAAVFELWSFFTDNTTVLVGAHVALAVFYLYTAYALIAYMFEDYWVTADELFAVAACFTVLVFAFAYLFLAVQEVWPESFTSFDGPGERTLSELLYFSGANLTSVGLSDVTAIRPHARSVTTVEQLGGVMYVAMVISRLVALTVIRARQ
ncbi:MAG: ion channel [Phycicoccus sp.]